jgi:hypothetical protein
MITAAFSPVLHAIPLSPIMCRRREKRRDVLWNGSFVTGHAVEEHRPA